MRLRIVLLTALVAAIVAGVVLSRPQKPTYEFDAVFDTARGIVPGQLVKVAGSRVGKIEQVNLTKDRKAAFRLKIKERFGPFHDDASCKILPEGFISESFIQCEPGTPGRPELRKGPDGFPTVPVERTEASVQLQQVLDTFSLPVDERIRVVLGELGIASGGRGQDLNALLRRANPALGQSRRLLDALAGQKAQINGAIAGTDAVLASLAGREKDVDGFVEKAATVTENLSKHRQGLGRSVASLPPLLDEVDASLGTLKEAAARLTPTARALGSSSSELLQANAVLQSVAKSGSPALKALEGPGRQVRSAVPATQEVVAQADQLATKLRPTAKLASDLFGSLRETGGVEQIENFLYTLSTTSSTFDGVSHLVPINLQVAARCFIDIELPGCRHQYNSPSNGQIPINSPSNPNTATERSGGKTGGSPAAKLPSLDDLPESTKRDLHTTLDRLLK